MSPTIVLDCIHFLAIHKKVLLQSLQSWHNLDGIAVKTSEYKVKYYWWVNPPDCQTKIMSNSSIFAIKLALL